MVAALAAPQSVTVQPGDTLSGLAAEYCGSAGDWASMWDANRDTIANPNLIYPGQVVRIACHAAAQVAAARSDPPASDPPAGHRQVHTTAVAAAVTGLSGTLGCTGLEALWEAAGGSHGEAFLAAEIAMAESGGRQYALSPTNDYGYWQINGSHGPAMATFDPMGNARAAIAISSDGTDWGAWTTYTEGLYAGRC